jgi:phosphate transport system permease protein
VESAGARGAGASEPRARLARRVVLLRRLGLVFRAGSTAVAVGILAIAVALGLTLLLDGWASIVRFGPAFLWGQTWDITTGVYGALPAICGTLITSGLALLLAVPVALGVALFLSEVAPRWAREALVYVVDLGAAIPSVVYGFWALFVVVPLMRTSVEPTLARVTGGTLLFSSTPIGLDLLTASVVLAIMIIPTVAAFSREALRAVPRVQRESALSLGATRWEATRMAVLGSARRGIIGAIMLGLGRAIGETIAVALVIGGGYYVPTSLFSQGSTIPSQLVNLFNDSYGLGLSALLELGLILFAISLGVNLVARLLLASDPDAAPRQGRLLRVWHRLVRRGPVGRITAPDGSGTTLADPPWRRRVTATFARRLRRRRARYYVVVALLLLALGLALLPLASIVDTAVAQGGTAVVTPSFYTSGFPVASLCTPGTPCPLGGIGPAIQGTLILLGLASIAGVPGGILAGIYLSEYGRRRFGRTVGLFVDVMVGIPSILLGLFVFALFLRYDFQDAQSALAGAAALSLLMVPIIARSTEDALRTVPVSVRESALALGFPRHRVTLRVVLGSSKSAIITGNLVALGRASGETAALVVTAGTSQYWFAGLHTRIAALAPFIYDSLTTSDAPNWQTDAWGAALILLLMMVLLSLAARLSLRGGGAAESV